MRIPLSWLKDYVDITISVEELAERLTLAGLEVASIEYIGVPQGAAPEGITVPPSDHLVWSRDKILFAAIREVKQHPNADRLVLAYVDYGAAELEQVVTGAPNLFPYKDRGVLETPLYTALALEGAEVYDGHAEGKQRMILKEKPLRGIPNRSMVCSAKELGISEEHEGIMLLEGIDAKPGTPLVDVLGDVVIDIELTPNLGHAYSILGVAREVAALTGQTVREPSFQVEQTGSPVADAIRVEIRDPEMNPRFTAMLIRDVQIAPSPQWLQRRLNAVGIRSINNIVDITNYVMIETGQPLHAFDYDYVLQRTGGQVATLITRRSRAGETLQTLDGVDRTFDDQVTVIVDANDKIISLAGIMGGQDSEIKNTTRNVLLEAANWNYINIRRTMFNQKMTSDAGLRFSRGIHPAQSERGLRRAAEMMRTLGKGTIAQGMIDVYPNPRQPVHVDLPLSEVERLIGIKIGADDVTGILRRLGFTVEGKGDTPHNTLHVVAPEYRVDISTGQIGIADLCEEIARIYGYDRIPDTLIDDMLPPQVNDEMLMGEEKARNLLAQLGLREVINYRLTTPEAEARLNALGGSGYPLDRGDQYVQLANPISADKAVMRRTLLNGVLEDVVRNARHHATQRLFEIGGVFIPKAGQLLPDEPIMLALALTGPRDIPVWKESTRESGSNGSHSGTLDFFDLKGVIESLAKGLRIGALTFKPEQHAAFHPGRCAGIYRGDKRIGVMGELHPVARAAYELEYAVVCAEIELGQLVAEIPLTDSITPIIAFPAVYQDIALVVANVTPAAEVETVIRRAGGELLRDVRLFDVYRGEPIPEGKKSMAYALTYQASDRTLTDKEVAKVHERIVKAAEKQLGAALRG
jgi:phenylalanyl-tRNA synthetase beta chain